MGAFNADGDWFVWLTVPDVESPTYYPFQAQLSVFELRTSEATTFDRVYERCYLGLRRSADVYFENDRLLNVAACREWARAKDGDEASPEAVAEALTSRTPEPFSIVPQAVERGIQGCSRPPPMVESYGLDPEGRVSVAIDALFAERISDDEMRGGCSDRWDG